MSDNDERKAQLGIDQESRIQSVENFLADGRERDLIQSIYTTSMQLVAFAQAAKKKGIRLKFKAKIESGSELEINDDGTAYAWVESFEVHLDPNGVVGEVTNG